MKPSCIFFVDGTQILNQSNKIILNQITDIEVQLSQNGDCLGNVDWCKRKVIWWNIENGWAVWFMKQKKRLSGSIHLSYLISLEIYRKIEWKFLIHYLQKLMGFIFVLSLTKKRLDRKNAFKGKNTGKMTLSRLTDVITIGLGLLL